MSLVSSDFLHDGRYLEYLKTGRGFFLPRKFIFAQIWAKRAKNGSKIYFFWIFLKNPVILVLPWNSLKWKLILLKFHHQSYIWQNSGSQVMGENAVGQHQRSEWWSLFLACR